MSAARPLRRRSHRSAQHVGYPVPVGIDDASGATAAALPAYQRALGAFLHWRGGGGEALSRALQEEPAFVMAHVLQGWLLLCGRDAQRVRAARSIWARAAALPANERERAHLGAMAAVLGDDYEAAKRRLGDWLRVQPRDALALQVAHAFDHVTGETMLMRGRAAGVVADLPGYPAVLAMHAFGLAENGEYERAEQTAREALALDPGNARAHHVMAHVFEMTERPQAGVRWLDQHAAAWTGSNAVSTHLWWHLALFHLTLDRGRRRPARCQRLAGGRRRRRRPRRRLGDLRLAGLRRRYLPPRAQAKPR
jgi:tetratricopeptide (TPR) repeat protein